MTPEQKARQISGTSPKANVNNQRFENRCMYVAAMYMYKWTKKRAIKVISNYLRNKVQFAASAEEQEFINELLKTIKKEL